MAHLHCKTESACITRLEYACIKESERLPSQSALLLINPQIVQVPVEMALDRAALLACGGLQERGRGQHSAGEAGCNVVGDWTGGVGLNAIQALSISGAARIIAVDIGGHEIYRLRAPLEQPTFLSQAR